MRAGPPKCDRYGENPRSFRPLVRIVSVVPGKDRSRDRPYLGGVKAKSKPPARNELYKLDVDEMKWRTWPGRRREGWQHTATPWKSSMIVFGGIGPQNPTLSRNATPKFFNTCGCSTPRRTPGARWGPGRSGRTAPCRAARTRRASSTATRRTRSAWGYGGRGSRRDFDDLSMLDLNTWWRRGVRRRRPPPAPLRRPVAATPGKLYVFGGWNAERQFSDVLVFDLATDTWSNLPPPPLAGPLAGGCPWGAKRWKHAAVAALGVPHFKVFVFGGNSGDLEEPAEEGEMGTYLNDTLVLDAAGAWSLPLWEPPSPARFVRLRRRVAEDGRWGWRTRVRRLRWRHLSEVAGPPTTSCPCRRSSASRAAPSPPSAGGV